jgi:hypothetical protein
MRLALAALATALLAGAAVAASDLDGLPPIGATAPAFGLHALRSDGAGGSEAKGAVELDSYCGVRVSDTTAVLLVFVSKESAEQDLNTAAGWMRRLEKDGLRILALSELSNPAESPILQKAKFPFPVLDDRVGVVARRFGLPRAPFAVLLDGRCSVLGYSDKGASGDKDRLGAALDSIVHGRLGQTEAF